ncbi:MAG: YggT family protein [Anaerolineales bacterium]|nr:YggT family protein [Anaerolineales bacterium]
MDFGITLITILANIIIWLVIANTLLSFFVSPYHPVRQTLDRLLEPMLRPIRRIVPPAGMFDFSPLVLILLLVVLRSILVSLLLTLR